MLSNVTYNINHLRDFSSIFMRNEVISWMKGDFSSLDTKIQRYWDFIPLSGKSSYLNFIKHAYNVLEKNYQNEYIYKNSFLNEWLIKELGESKSVVFNEFRVGNSVADLAMFNGVSKAFEIKTKFDSDARLGGQLKEYKRAFNEVFLIIPKDKLPFYQKHTSDLGVILYDESENQRFELIQKSKFQAKIDPAILMEVLHTQEYKEIVIQYFGELPVMNSFNQFNICFDLIESIPSKKLNKLYLNQMKKRKQGMDLSSRYYKELNQISLALKLKKKEKVTLINNLKNPVKL